jgi:hypothetical protein
MDGVNLLRRLLRRLFTKPVDELSEPWGDL